MTGFTRRLAPVALVVGLATGPASAGLELIFSEIPGHGTATVPGARDLAGEPVFAEFKAMEVLSVSPDGSQWILKSRSTLDSDMDTMLMLGAEGSGSVLAQEGQPVHDGEKGELYDFFGSSPPCFNELGQYVYTARARGGDPTRKHKGILFDGVEHVVFRQESDPALDLLDVPGEPSGDELFGNSFGSMHLLNDGRIGAQDSTIKNIHSSRRPAIFYDDSSFLQSGVSPLGELTWDSFDSNDFHTTPDGTRWIAQGDDDGPTDEDDVLVVDGSVVLREGSLVADSSIVMAEIFATVLLANGDWYTRGDDAINNDWAVRNDTLLAATGDPVTAGADEHWTAIFYAVTGNRFGDWVIVGTTDNADPAIDSIIVLNGTEVLVREGDPVDADGNGEFDDDVFIGRGDPDAAAFRPDDVALTDDGVLYFLASLRDGAGNDLGADGLSGDALLRLVANGCPEDLDGSGAVDFGDILAILAAWGDAGGPEDLDDSGTVDFGDVLVVLGVWGPCA